MMARIAKNYGTYLPYVINQSKQGSSVINF